MAGFYGKFPAYEPVGDRLERGRREVIKRLRPSGRAPAPVLIEGKKLTRTFWGDAWCENLERYSDLANRLPRGRTYVRNGSVVDLHVGPGQVSAFVAGSDLYSVRIDLDALDGKRWRALVAECAGKIGSLVGLLRGELSGDVLAVLTRAGTGLFPEPREIQMDCSCPDAASLCKHLAAVLYGVGARLDAAPELFFTLRRVDQAELLAGATVDAVLARSGSGKKKLEPARLGGIFGIELADESMPAPLEQANPKPTKKRNPTEKTKPTPTPKPTKKR